MTDKQRTLLLRKAIARLKLTEEGYGPGGHWTAAMALLQDLDEDLAKKELPLIGPLQLEGVPLSKMSLTHRTDGLPLYPALDTAWTSGTRITAPENGKVERHSGNSNSGYSVYMKGASGLKYYFTHLDVDGRAALGAVKRGSILGRVGNPAKYPGQRVAHVHAGVNAEHFLGKGEQLEYGKNGNGPDYTVGSPSIGEQLKNLIG